MDEDISYALYFAQGRHSARVGQTLTASPYIGHGLSAWQAWHHGYKSVDFSSLGASDRALVFVEGWSAAQVKLDPRHCPYLVDDGCEKVDLWVLGYTSATALQQRQIVGSGPGTTHETIEDRMEDEKVPRP